MGKTVSLKYQPRLATFCGARPGDRDTGRETAPVLRAYIKSSVQDPGQTITQSSRHVGNALVIWAEITDTV